VCRQKRKTILRYFAVPSLCRAALALDDHRGCYYLIFFFLLFRLLRLSTHPARWYVALALILFMMIANGLTNYVIFRARDLYLSFIIGAIAPITDIALFVLLARLDRTAALAMIPYLLYRVYAVYWGYALWRANQSV